MLLFLFTLFLPLQEALAQNITSREEAKSIIESSIQEASTAIEDNKKLREERKKYIKTTQVFVSGGMGGGVVPQEETAPGQETQLNEIDTKIENNNTLIKNKKETAEKALKYLKKNFTSDAEKTENDQYEELISAGFNETGNGEMEPCWSLTGGIAWSACVMTAGSWIASIIIYFFGGFLYIAGALFDASIMVSIEWLSSIFQADYISSAWKVVRDFANIFFIFILLYIAVGTIFDLNGIGSPQKMVVNVIIIALLVNFSGFFVRVVVDATNIIAYEFYSSAKGDSDNIGSSIVTKLIPEGYLVDKNAKLEGKPYFKGTSILNIFLTTIISIIIILVTCFVLITASILFIIRTIILIFIYIISPFAFMSQIIPNKNFDYFTQWKNALTKQSLYAPGFLIPLYLVVLLLNGDLLGGRLAQMDGGVVDTLFSGALMAILNGLLGIGLIISCIFIAQKFGAVGLGLATAMGAKFTQGSSQIMGRFGGRAARAIGNRIPGREALRDSWNEGRLSRVRQSWDTGVLRTMRDTDTAKAVGQAVKNPLFSAGAGIGFMANQMGVKGMDNIVGDKIFSKEVEERAGKYLEEMRKMETDNDRVRYLESLAGQGKREEFDAVYAKLSPEERRKLESSARKRATSIDPNVSKQTKDNARRVADKMATARRGMKGKKGQENAVEIFRNEKDDTIKLETIRNLEPEDFIESYKELKPEERAKLEKLASTDWQLTGKILRARQELKPKDINAVERETAKQNRIKDAEELITSGQRLEDPMVAFNPQSPNAGGTRNQINKIRNLSAEEFRTFIQENNVFDGNHRDIYPYLTAEQLKVVLSEIGAAERQEIRSVIETNRPANNPPHPDIELEKAYQYLNDPRRNGISF